MADLPLQPVAIWPGQRGHHRPWLIPSPGSLPTAGLRHWTHGASCAPDRPEREDWTEFRSQPPQSPSGRLAGSFLSRAWAAGSSEDASHNRWDSGGADVGLQGAEPWEGLNRAMTPPRLPESRWAGRAYRSELAQYVWLGQQITHRDSENRPVLGLTQHAVDTSVPETPNVPKSQLLTGKAFLCAKTKLPWVKAPILFLQKSWGSFCANSLSRSCLFLPTVLPALPHSYLPRAQASLPPPRPLPSLIPMIPN